MGLLVWNCLLDGLHASSFAKITEFYKTQRFGTGSIYICVLVCVYVYIYIYIYMCVCVCVRARARVYVCMHV